MSAPDPRSLSDLSLQEIQSFCNRFRELDQKTDHAVIKAFQPIFKSLASQYQQIEQRELEEARQNGYGYNIFTVLRIDRYEAYTHSAMLAHLLNPAETHQQGFLFLKSFLAHCADKYPQFPHLDNIEVGSWEITAEFYTERYGIMDIVLRNSALDFLCVIENKVDALEQDNQLARYSDWMDIQKEQSKAILFLTPNGRKPTTAGKTKPLCISYHEDIYQWLEGSITSSLATNVAEVLKQYGMLVRYL